MSGGQDEASEYIQTGGTNVFKKTERTKCGNCVYFSNGKCVRMPMTWTKLPEDYCGEFVDREPHSNTGDVTVRKECDQPAGELREWWIRERAPSCETYDIAYLEKLRGSLIHVREVPSPERVRAALDEWAKAEGLDDWATAGCWPRRHMLDLLRSLGVPTECL